MIIIIVIIIVIIIIVIIIIIIIIIIIHWLTITFLLDLGLTSTLIVKMLVICHSSSQVFTHLEGKIP